GTAPPAAAETGLSAGASVHPAKLRAISGIQPSRNRCKRRPVRHMRPCSSRVFRLDTLVIRAIISKQFQSRQTAVAVLRSITERTVRWTASIFLTLLFGMLAPPDLQSATCSVRFGNTGGMISAFHTAKDGTLLIGAQNGLFRLDGDKLVEILKPGGPHWINALHAAKDGTLLIGATEGLFRFDGDKFVIIDKDRSTGDIRAFH